jgi:hypothetical protein
MTADQLRQRVTAARPHRRTVTVVMAMTVVVVVGVVVVAARVMTMFDDRVVMLVRHPRPFEVALPTSKVQDLR